MMNGSTLKKKKNKRKKTLFNYKKKKPFSNKVLPKSFFGENKKPRRGNKMKFKATDNVQWAS